MARMGTIATRASALLDSAVVATTSVAGGDICTATRLRLSDGRSALIKTRPHAPATFFAVEARGLSWLRGAGGAAVPEVLACAADCLVISWVEPGQPSPEAAEAFGRRLAVTHGAGAESFGAAEDGFIGTLPLPNKPADGWAEFLATRRVLPYLRAARDRSAVTAEDAAAVEEVLRRLDELGGPAEPPARIHGDLWSGNVHWARDGRARLIDPATQGGHPEADLAMLELFGCPQLGRLISAYEEARPTPGRRERVPLHQLHLLLFHAARFGSGFGDYAGTAARLALANLG